MENNKETSCIMPKLPSTFKGEYGHWLPLITFCPVSYLPDIGYIRIKTSSFVEIYGMRKIILKNTFKKIFMEDLVSNIKSEIEKNNDCKITIQYRMLFNKVVIGM